MIRREILKEVLLDNRNEVVKHQVIPRSFQFEEFGNYVFVGIRRAGKSFLLYQRIQELLHNGHTWNEMLYVNFEDERLIGRTASDLNLILEVHAEMSTDRPMLFLDEIQNIDGWDKFVRRLADNKYRAYVTGSNAKMLSQDVATTLGGRYITVHVYPYDFKEFLYANGVEVTENSLFATESRAEIKRIFNDYFRSGGFPEGASLAAKRDYLTSVYQKIYLGDIAARHSIENTFALRILFRKLAESIKQPVSFTRITNIVASTGVKISKNTVINYMEYAKDACLLIPIQNIADKLVERETNPKYYFADNASNQMLYYQIIPMLRMSEVYLIAIETTKNLVEANQLYADYMRDRDVVLNENAFGSLDDVQGIIVDEYRREFFAEGQTFYMYKRLNIKDVLWYTKGLTEQDYVLWKCVSTEFNA